MASRLPAATGKKEALSKKEGGAKGMQYVTYRSNYSDSDTPEQKIVVLLLKKAYEEKESSVRVFTRDDISLLEKMQKVGHIHPNMPAIEGITTAEMSRVITRNYASIYIELNRSVLIVGGQSALNNDEGKNDHAEPTALAELLRKMKEHDEFKLLFENKPLASELALLTARKRDKEEIKNYSFGIKKLLEKGGKFKFYTDRAPCKDCADLLRIVVGSMWYAHGYYSVNPGEKEEVRAALCAILIGAIDVMRPAPVHKKTRTKEISAENWDREIEEAQASAERATSAPKVGVGATPQVALPSSLVAPTNVNLPNRYSRGPGIRFYSPVSGEPETKASKRRRIKLARKKRKMRNRSK